MTELPEDWDEMTEPEKRSAYLDAEARADALDVETLADDLERAMRAHIFGKRGWPHVRGGPMPGDGPEHIDGCNDICATDIVAEYLAILAEREP